MSLKERYGMLAVVERLAGSKILCICDCGKERTVYVGHLNSGSATSCGCHVRKKGDPKPVYTEAEMLAIARESLRQDPDTGYLYWVKSGRRAVAGQRAGTVGTHGYRQVYLGSRNHREHRICWLLAYGEWPEAEIDHINGVKDDNRLSNLRSVSRAQNLQNITEASSRSKSGLRGVYLDPRRGRWRAEIRAHGVVRYLGSFDSKIDASAAYMRAKSELHIGGGQ